MNKKAEWVQENIGTIIILLISFGVLVNMAAKIYSSYNPDSAACQQSVSIRGALPEMGKDYSPLRCKTEKYCFISSSGDCRETWGDAKDVAYVKVKSKLDIEKFIADKMVSCHEMMGKGKLSLFTMTASQAYNNPFSVVYPTCVVCSRFAFNFPSLAKQNINFNDINVMQYMASYKMSGRDISYLNYFSEGSGKIVTNNNLNFNELSARLNEFKQEVQSTPIDSKFTEEEKQELLSNTNKFEQAFEQDYKNSNTEINLDTLKLAELESEKELGIIFMQITAPGNWDGVATQLATLGIVGGASVKIVGVKSSWGMLKTLFGASSSSNAYALGKMVGKTIKFAKNPWVLIAIAAYLEYNVIKAKQQQAVAMDYCGEFGLGEEIRFGCSATKLTYYNESEIKNMCGYIESV